MAGAAGIASMGAAMAAGSLMGGMSSMVAMAAQAVLAAAPQYVVHGAEISCPFALRNSNVVVPLSHGVFIHNIEQLTIGDFLPQVNVLGFGACTSPENPSVQAAAAQIVQEVNSQKKGWFEKIVDFFCKPKEEEEMDESFISQCAGVCTPIFLMPWDNGKEEVEVEGKPPLLDKATLLCLYGGEIKIEKTGQPE